MKIKAHLLFYRLLTLSIILSFSQAASRGEGQTLTAEAGYEPGPDMNANRHNHHAVVLPTGNVALIAGRTTGFVSLDTTEIFNPVTETFTTLTMRHIHDSPSFAKMSDGRYLIAGGSRNLGIPSYSHTEIFDPVDLSFTATGSMVRFRASGGAAALNDGRIVIASAWWTHNNAHTWGELYNPGTGTFSEIGPFAISRAHGVVIPTNDGQAMLVGGVRPTGTAENLPVELYNPQTGAVAVLQDYLLDEEELWRFSGGQTITAYHQLNNGSYLWMAFNSEDGVTQYRLITVNPETKAVEELVTSPALPTSESFSFIGHPVIDNERGRTYLIARVRDDAPSYRIAVFTVDLATGGLTQSSNFFTLPGYELRHAPAVLLNDGRLFVSGGSISNNFDAVNNTLYITPPQPSQIVDGFTLSYTAGAGGSIQGNTSQHVVTGGDAEEVTAVANEGWVFLQWSDGVLPATRQDLDIQQPVNVTALFLDVSEAGFAGGSGTSVDPFLVSDAMQLFLVRLHPDAYFRQIADIALDESPWTDAGGWVPIGTVEEPFTGSYNGDGFEVSGMQIDRAFADHQGLFGQIAGAHLANLEVTEFTLIGGNRCGGLVGDTINGSRVTHCGSSGTVTAVSRAGGLVGASGFGGKIEGSHSSAMVTGSGDRIGGLAGQSWSDSDSCLVINSHATGNVSGLDMVGGLVGFVRGSEVRDSSAEGTVEGNLYVGGFIGWLHDASAPGNSAVGSVRGNQQVGGLVGRASESSISASHATGNVYSSAARVGGLVGENQGTIEDSYAAGRSESGTGYVGGLVGVNFSAIIRSRATGEVVAENLAADYGAGGLAGYHGLPSNNPDFNPLIEDSHASGKVSVNMASGAGTAGMLGGLIGLFGNGGTIHRAYASSVIEGEALWKGGLIGRLSDIDTEVVASYWDMSTSGITTSPAGEGRTTAQMTYPHSADTYVGWDFDHVWAMDVDGNINNGYPYLRFPVEGEGPEVTPNGIPHAWLAAHGLPTDGSADHSIPQGKNLTVLQHYIALIDPTDPSSRFVVGQPVVEAGGFEIHFQPASPDRRYTLWRSVDLVEWSIVPGQSDVPGGSGPLIDANPPGGGAFYRVEVALPYAPAPAPTGFSLIPADTYARGDHKDEPEEWMERSRPVHEVSVSAFYMAQTPVTYAEWRDVYDWAVAHGYTFDNAGQRGSNSNGNALPDTPENNQHPVTWVNWYDVVKWSNAKSERAGLTPVYYTNDALTTVYRQGRHDVTITQVDWSANGYRLPTEAEWEKAARGGLVGKRWPWGDAEIDGTRANYWNSSATNGTTPVGSYAANGYGLYDMAGNVWEWNWDWFLETWYSQAGASEADTRGPVSGSSRVNRGGSWRFESERCRVASRGRREPDYLWGNLGFRLVRTP